MLWADNFDYPCHRRNREPPSKLSLKTFWWGSHFFCDLFAVDRLLHRDPYLTQSVSQHPKVSRIHKYKTKRGPRANRSTPDNHNSQENASLNQRKSGNNNLFGLSLMLEEAVVKPSYLMQSYLLSEAQTPVAVLPWQWPQQALQPIYSNLDGLSTPG